MSEEERRDFSLSVETLPGSVVSNIAALKEWIDKNVEPYLGQVVTPDQARFAKSDLAMLRKVKTQLEDERKRAKSIIMKPYTDFEALYKDAVASLDRAIAGIDAQVKAIDASQKDARRKELMDFIMKSAADISGESLVMRLERQDVMGWFFDEKWLNSSTSMSSVKASISEKLVTVDRDIQCIVKTANTPLAFDTYYRTGSLSAALEADRRAAEEAKRLKAIEEERKATSEATAEFVPERIKTWDEVVKAHEESLRAKAERVPQQIVLTVPEEPAEEKLRAMVQIPTILEFPRYKMALVREIMTMCGIRMLNPNKEQK